MVNCCVRIEAPRDISRQILRHRSFYFQEFSGRYADYEGLLPGRAVRMQDTKNRQNSIPADDPVYAELRNNWDSAVESIRDTCWAAYRYMRDSGVAKEVARTLLPEGFVPTVLYVNGNLRSWIHYWGVRCDPNTQLEHREIAEKTREIVLKQFPLIKEILDQDE